MNIDQRIKALLRRVQRMAEQHKRRAKRMDEEHKKSRAEMKRLDKLIRELPKPKQKKPIRRLSNAKLKTIVAEITEGTKALLKTKKKD